MDTPTNSPENTFENQLPSSPSSDMGMNGDALLDDLNTEDQSGVSGVLRSIPWKRIVFGALLLFFFVWGLVYLFTSGSSRSPVVVPPVVIEESKRVLATEQASIAAGLLGSASYNAILQPNFSLNPVDITANEPKIALLQSASVLEQVLAFDLLAHLETQSNKNDALQQYENKLNQSLGATEQWLTVSADRLRELAGAITNATQQKSSLLQEVNAALVSDPAAATFPALYGHFVEANNQVLVLESDQGLLTQIIRQVNPLLAQARIRKENITLNRDALLQGIQVVDLDDPGLSLILKR